MARYITPAGVVIEMSDQAAAAVGYKTEPAAALPAEAADTPEPAKRKPGRPKKSQ